MFLNLTVLMRRFFFALFCWSSLTLGPVQAQTASESPSPSPNANPGPSPNRGAVEPKCSIVEAADAALCARKLANPKYGTVIAAVASEKEEALPHFERIVNGLIEIDRMEMDDAVYRLMQIASEGDFLAVVLQSGEKSEETAEGEDPLLNFYVLWKDPARKSRRLLQVRIADLDPYPSTVDAISWALGVEGDADWTYKDFEFLASSSEENLNEGENFADEEYADEE